MSINGLSQKVSDNLKFTIKFSNNWKKFQKIPAIDRCPSYKFPEFQDDQTKIAAAVMKLAHRVRSANGKRRWPGLHFCGTLNIDPSLLEIMIICRHEVQLRRTAANDCGGAGSRSIRNDLRRGVHKCRTPRMTRPFKLSTRLLLVYLAFFF